MCECNSDQELSHAHPVTFSSLLSSPLLVCVFIPHTSLTKHPALVPVSVPLSPAVTGLRFAPQTASITPATPPGPLQQRLHCAVMLPSDRRTGAALVPSLSLFLLPAASGPRGSPHSRLNKNPSRVRHFTRYYYLLNITLYT